MSCNSIHAMPMHLPLDYDIWTCMHYVCTMYALCDFVKFCGLSVKCSLDFLLPSRTGLASREKPLNIANLKWTACQVLELTWTEWKKLKVWNAWIQLRRDRRRPFGDRSLAVSFVWVLAFLVSAAFFWNLFFLAEACSLTGFQGQHVSGNDRQGRETYFDKQI